MQIEGAGAGGGGEGVVRADRPARLHHAAGHAFGADAVQTGQGGTCWLQQRAAKTKKNIKTVTRGSRGDSIISSF